MYLSMSCRPGAFEAVSFCCTTFSNFSRELNDSGMMGHIVEKKDRNSVGVEQRVRKLERERNDKEEEENYSSQEVVDHDLSGPLYVWMAIFLLQPHKEERFLFPVYGLICFAGAAAVTTVSRAVEHVVGKQVSAWRLILSDLSSSACLD